MYKPFVSIYCITYNHKNYIAKAIDSFLMQKTNFPFELVIGEDFSTDGTSDVICLYK
jgi:glycosyltransferase involved in cell wall biosynthesis